MTADQKAALERIIREELSFTAPELLEFKLTTKLTDFIDDVIHDMTQQKHDGD